MNKKVMQKFTGVDKFNDLMELDGFIYATDSYSLIRHKKPAGDSSVYLAGLPELRGLDFSHDPVSICSLGEFSDQLHEDWISPQCKHCEGFGDTVMFHNGSLTPCVKCLGTGFDKDGEKEINKLFPHRIKWADGYYYYTYSQLRRIVDALSKLGCRVFRCGINNGILHVVYDGYYILIQRMDIVNIDSDPATGLPICAVINL